MAPGSYPLYCTYHSLIYNMYVYLFSMIYTICSCAAGTFRRPEWRRYSDIHGWYCHIYLNNISFSSSFDYHRYISACLRRLNRCVKYTSLPWHIYTANWPDTDLYVFLYTYIDTGHLHFRGNNEIKSSFRVDDFGRAGAKCDMRDEPCLLVNKFIQSKLYFLFIPW